MIKLDNIYEMLTTVPGTRISKMKTVVIVADVNNAILEGNHFWLKITYFMSQKPYKPSLFFISQS